MPALDIFYSLSLAQGVLFYVWCLIGLRRKSLVSKVSQRCGFGDWGEDVVERYLEYTSNNCWEDHSSIEGMSLVTYAASLLQSESMQEYLTGARILDAFMQKTEGRKDEALSEIRHSKHLIEKLVGTLNWRREDDREIRKLAARILAVIAGELRLAQFPEAALSISSLLEITPEQIPEQDAQQEGTEQRQQVPVREIAEHNSDETQPLLPQHESSGVSDERTSEESGQDTGRELIHQGLLILEGLIADEDNCREMSNSPGLVSKITAPVMYYSILRQNEYDANWIHDIVDRSLKVLCKLISAPAENRRRLCREISSNHAAVSNMKSILRDESSDLDLRRHVLKILTKLAVAERPGEGSGNAKQLIDILLHIFFVEVDIPEETVQAEIRIALGNKSIMLKKAAGEALAELTKQSASNAAVLLTPGGTIVQKLTNMLLDNTHNEYRTSAIEIFEHLCAHSTKEQENLLKTTTIRVLPEVLKGTLDGETQEQDDQAKKSKLQEACLALVVRACDKMISAEDFANARRMISLGDGEFVEKLKDIVKANNHRVVGCLRTIKLTTKLVTWMMQHDNRYINLFRERNLVESLSKAEKNLVVFESCVVFRT